MLNYRHDSANESPLAIASDSEGLGGEVRQQCIRYFFSVQWPIFHASEEKGEYSTLVRSGR